MGIRGPVPRPAHIQRLLGARPGRVRAAPSAVPMAGDVPLLDQVDEDRAQGGVFDRPRKMRLNFRRLQFALLPKDAERLQFVLIQRIHVYM